MTAAAIGCFLLVASPFADVSKGESPRKIGLKSNVQGALKLSERTGRPILALAGSNQ